MLQFDDWTTADWIAGIAALAGIAQAIALVFTIIVLVRTARRQLRAYVFVDSVDVEGIQVGEQPSVAIKIKNFGQTPAYDLAQWVGLRFDAFDNPKFPDVPFGKAELWQRPLAPGDTAELHPNPLRNPITEAHMTALAAGEAAIWIFGEIRYRDAFKKRRRTRYRLFLNNETRMIGFAPHHQGNDAN